MENYAHKASVNLFVSILLHSHQVNAGFTDLFHLNRFFYRIESLCEGVDQQLTSYHCPGPRSRYVETLHHPELSKAPGVLNAVFYT